MGLKERANAIPPPAEEYLTVTLLDRDAPLTGKLAFTTEATYRRVANRQRRISLEERPRYLVQRADELSRSAWWLEHVVMRRELYAMELAAKKAGQEPLRRELNELRTGIEAMDYRALRQEENDSPFNPARAPIPPQVLSKLKQEAKARGDQELRDAIVISEATGLRPIELSQGVRLELDGKTVRIHIQGGKARARHFRHRGAVSSRTGSGSGHRSHLQRSKRTSRAPSRLFSPGEFPGRFTLALRPSAKRDTRSGEHPVLFLPPCHQKPLGVGREHAGRDCVSNGAPLYSFSRRIRNRI